MRKFSIIISLALLLLLYLSTPIAAQHDEQTHDTGFHPPYYDYGMTASEAQSVVPSLDLQSGELHTTLRANELQSNIARAPYMEGAESVALEFTNGLLTYVRVNYPVTNAWESPDEFIAALAAKLNLKGDWKHFYDWETKDVRDTKELRDLALECDGFRLSAGIGVEGIGGDQTPHFEMEETK